MTYAELMIVSALGALAGGALGAKLSNAAAWKGFIIIVIAGTTPMIAFALLGIDNLTLSLLANVMVAGLIGTMFKLSIRQTTMIILGSTFCSTIAGFAFGFIPSFGSHLGQ